MNTARIALLLIGCAMQGVGVFYLFRSGLEMRRGVYSGTSWIGATWAWGGLIPIGLSLALAAVAAVVQRG